MPAVPVTHCLRFPAIVVTVALSAVAEKGRSAVMQLLYPRYYAAFTAIISASLAF